MVRIRPERNEVVVGSREDLLTGSVELRDPVWWTEADDEFRVTAELRYHAARTPAAARRDGDAVHIVFDEPVQRPAPGQSVVLRVGDVIVGGGIAAGW